MAKVASLGAGAWGIALGTLLDSNGHDVTMWTFLQSEADMLINDKEFSNKFFSSKGLCMKHFEKVLRYAKGDLKNQIIEHQKKEMKRVMDDVDRFVLKFDYRNADMPWENAKDATERAILKLRGDYFGKY